MVWINSGRTSWLAEQSWTMFLGLRTTRSWSKRLASSFWRSSCRSRQLMRSSRVQYGRCGANHGLDLVFSATEATRDVQREEKPFLHVWHGCTDWSAEYRSRVTLGVMLLCGLLRDWDVTLWRVSGWATEFSSAPDKDWRRRLPRTYCMF